MIAGRNGNSPGTPRGWCALAWQAQHHPAFLGYLLRDLDESSIALTLEVGRMTVWQLKLCLRLRGAADVRVLEEQFGLRGGCLEALLEEIASSATGGEEQTSAFALLLLPHFASLEPARGCA